ncbi:hypothetical protein [Myxococcus sp. Y35]|uniref:hypothetical protein n=1 Tax=Pseudomyxococcus flavus TaxID=3115648 RepID=UPI003CFAC6A0
MELEVDDDEGEMKTFSYNFSVPNVPPSFEVTSFSQVVVGNPITLGVTTTTDPDGGELEFVWDILEAPNRTPQSGYSTEPSLSIHTTGAEVGTWRFRVTATDDEDEPASASEEVTVEVVNRKPRIALSGTPRVAEGSPLHVETSVLEDDDGGWLTFTWEVVQAPTAAGVPLGTVLSTQATLDYTVPAGTWIFRVTATDDEQESVSEEFTVLVDGLPHVAFFNPPSQHVIGSGPLVLNASLSEDPDSPCPEDVNRCHLRDGGFATVSQGITSYAWYASVGGQPLLPIHTLWPHINDSGPVVTLGANDLGRGTWLFELRILDGEGNPASSQLTVSAVSPDTPPSPSVAGPLVRPTVSLAGVTPVHIGVDGSQSFDLDNTFEEQPPSPGLGISNYQWLAIGPPGCPPPTLPSGPGVSAVLLFPAGSIVPPVCQGTWTVRLTVTDDDPAAQQSIATTSFAIGNCADLACLDTPTASSPRRIREDAPSGVLVAMHVDSAFYDSLLFSMGMSVRVDFIPTGTSTPVFSTTTPTLDQTSRGQVLYALWNGSTSDGSRAAGTFDVVLSLQTASGDQPRVAVGSGALVLEDVKTQVLALSDRRVQYERLEQPGGSANFQVRLSGLLPSTPVDSISWRVKDEAATVRASGTLSGSGGASQTVAWDGRSEGQVVPAGEYTFEAQAIRNGGSLGWSPAHAFTVFSLRADPIVTAPAAPDALPEWVHLERTLPPSDVNASNFGERRLKMSPLELRVTPLAEGASVILAQESGPAGLVEFYENGSTYAPVTLPRQWAAANQGSVEARLLAYGRGTVGDAVFTLTYMQGSTKVGVARVRYRLGMSPAAVGMAEPLYTSGFRTVRTVNEGSPIQAALDRTRHRERAGRRAQVYLVAHRSAAEWAANPALTDVTGAPKELTVGAASAALDVLTLWASASRGEHGRYDVVYDFGNFADSADAFVGNGRLDPGDILDSPDGRAAVEVEATYLAAGGLPTTTIEYGTGLGTPRFSAHLPGDWDGVQAGGFDFTLHGRLVYPTDLSVPRPLVVFAHGKHMPRQIISRGDGSLPPKRFQMGDDMTSDENYRGYTYLQQHLASRGYITASVDLDSMHGSPQLGYPGVKENAFAIQARAWIILKNIELLVQNAQASALAGRIDTSRIYLVGHSRGGEAMVVAWNHLKQLSLPTRPPGAIPPGETLSGISVEGIKGIISLAPVSLAFDTYKDAILPTQTPLLLLYGSADADVKGVFPGLQPFIHYDRALSDRFAIRIEGANHNYFNTSWGYSDASQQPLFKGVDSTSFIYENKALDVPMGAASTLLTGDEQRSVAMAYVTAFLEVVERGDRGAREYFLQPPTRLAPLGVPARVRMYAQAQLRLGVNRFTLDDFETATDEDESSSGQLVAFELEDVNEEALYDEIDIQNPLGESEGEENNRFFQATRGVLVSWTGSSFYEQHLAAAQRDLRSASSLNFRVAQQPMHALTGTGGVSFRVQLVDAAGRAETVSLQAFTPIAPIYPSTVWIGAGGRYLDNGQENPKVRPFTATAAAFQTYRLPLAGFGMTAANLDLSQIAKVRFQLGDAETSQGRVAVDDLEIEF